jgi:prepilin-type N-terminal cleavage/methylation domain-containing protein
LKERRLSFGIIATDRGFSMIEAIVVLIIIAILAPIVVSQAFKQADTTPLITEAEILKANLRYAQIRAMNDTMTWGLYLEETKYSLYKNGSKASIGFPGRYKGDKEYEDYKDSYCYNNPNELAVYCIKNNVAVSSGAGTTITFNAWGVPVDGSGTALSSNTTVTLSLGGSSSTVTITKNTGYIP